jgi:hypothetical protein
MLTSRQRLIGHSRALMLWGFLGIAVLMVWMARGGTWNVLRVATTSLVDSYQITSSREASPSENGPSSQAIPIDDSDDNSNDNLNPIEQVDEGQPDAPVLLQSLHFICSLQAALFIPWPTLIAPSDPPPRPARFFEV